MARDSAFLSLVDPLLPRLGRACQNSEMGSGSRLGGVGSSSLFGGGQKFDAALCGWIEWFSSCCPLAIIHAVAATGDWREAG